MKNTLTALAAAAMMAVTLVPATTSISQARTAEIVRLKSEGFRNCRALGDSGYTAVVRGTSLFGASRNGSFGNFNLRSCFQTRAECTRFINSIPRIVRGFNDIHYASCTARG